MNLFRKNRKGQAFVEFAASVVVLTIIGFGAIDLSRGISTYQRMNSVGREAGRVFLKSSFDTTNFTDTQLKAEVGLKVYNALKTAMLPDKLDEDGLVIITIARRIQPATESTSTNSTDQIKITHQFLFPGSVATGLGPSRIPDELNDKIIAGPPETTPSYPGFVPVGTIRLNEELIIVEIFYHYQFMTPIPKLVPGLNLDILYDRTVF